VHEKGGVNLIYAASSSCVYTRDLARYEVHEKEGVNLIYAL
jgi:hypothetical protein